MQPVVEHAPHDGRGRRGTKTGVFHDGGHGNARLIQRGKGDVEGVIALVLGQRGGVVAAFLRLS